MPSDSDPNAVAFGVSGDGQIVVGRKDLHGFRWTERDGVAELANSAHAISGDGSTIVGVERGPLPGIQQGYVLTDQYGVELLGDLVGDNVMNSAARGVSRDGSLVVGDGTLSYLNAAAFWWAPETGLVRLDGGQAFTSTFALGVSDDGRVIVGRGQSQRGSEAFRWTSEEGFVGLGDLRGGIFASEAAAASGDGSRIVGYSQTADGDTAMIWTEVDGMRALADVIADAEPNLDGWSSTRAMGISSDGRFVVGYGDNPESCNRAWLVELPAPEPSSGGGAAGVLAALAVLSESRLRSKRTLAWRTRSVRIGRLSRIDGPKN